VNIFHFHKDELRFYCKNDVTDIIFIITSLPGGCEVYCDEYVYLFVCMSVAVAIDAPLTALRYIVYFRFCG